MVQQLKNKQGVRFPQARHLFWMFIFVIFFFATAHDDLLETSNHGWLLLECIRNGRFLDYYNIVAAHQNSLYYLNNAHYNIICYLIYALWQLPIYLLCLFTKTAVNEYFLLLWSKAVGVAAYCGCGFVVRELAKSILPTTDGQTEAAAFLLDPIAFFSAMVIAQYDSLCLFPLLLAVLFWTKGKYIRFALTTGAALVFKFFPLLLFLPLLLLVEKRPLRLLGYTAMTFWLYLPTALLFRGRIGDMGFFTNMMIDEVFAAQLPGGIAPIPVFITLYAVFLVGCYLYPPTLTEAVRRMPWIGLAVYGTFFLFTRWHPQWLILIIPFFVLSIMQQKQKAPWYYGKALLFAGYLLCATVNYPKHFEIGLFGNGAFRILVAALPKSENAFSFYLYLIPHLQQLIPALFAAPLIAAILFLFPLNSGSLGDHLSNEQQRELAPAQGEHYLIQIVWTSCILGLWLGSVALTVLAAVF